MIADMSCKAPIVAMPTEKKRKTRSIVLLSMVLIPSSITSTVAIVGNAAIVQRSDDKSIVLIDLVLIEFILITTFRKNGLMSCV